MRDISAGRPSRAQNPRGIRPRLREHLVHDREGRPLVMLKVGQVGILERELHENIGSSQLRSDYDKPVPIRLLLPLSDLRIGAVKWLGPVESHDNRPRSIIPEI